MLLTGKKVAIIGAGPVGLTMARLLQLQGVAVTVYERDEDALTRISGGTLDLHKGSGQDAMAAAGLLDRYYALAIPMGRAVANHQGHVLQRRKPAPDAHNDNPEINRNDLRKMLLDSLDDNTVIWDRKLTGLSAQSDQWILQFDGHEDAAADLVIGANGGRSRVRAYVTDARIEYTGTLMIQGEVPDAATACTAFYALCNDDILMAANQDNLLVANPKNGALLSYSVIFKMPEHLRPEDGPVFPDQAAILRFLQDKYTAWADCYQELFRATTSFVLWPTRKIPLDIPWKTNRPLPVTLIGDAAHIMPPFAGQGVNIGLLDAMILANNLTGGRYLTLDAAIEDYERQMMVYAGNAQATTSRNETAMLDPGFSFARGV